MSDVRRHATDFAFAPQWGRAWPPISPPNSMMLQPKMLMTDIAKCF